MSVGSGLFAGCATTEVTGHQPLVNEMLPRPNDIWVYDFAVTPADMPRSSGFADPSSVPPGRKPPRRSRPAARREQSGGNARRAIRDMGLPAERPSPQTQPQTNDLVIWGYFISLDEGTAVQRIAIGFGSGSSQLTTAVEAYQMTPTGLRKLGWAKWTPAATRPRGRPWGGRLHYHRQPGGPHRRRRIRAYGKASGRSGVPGRARATAKAIAKELKPQFAQEGWIQP